MLTCLLQVAAQKAQSPPDLKDTDDFKYITFTEMPPFHSGVCVCVREREREREREDENADIGLVSATTTCFSSVGMLLFSVPALAHCNAACVCELECVVACV